jgi:hypothetical protein
VVKVAGQVPHSTMHERYIPVEAVAKSSNTIIAVRLIPNESIDDAEIGVAGGRVVGECQAGEKARCTTARRAHTHPALVTHSQHDIAYLGGSQLR